MNQLASSKWQSTADRSVAGLMLLLWLATAALTVFPQLHQLLHQDSQGPDHHCLVTQIQQHSLLAASAPVLTGPAPLGAELVGTADVQFVAFHDYRLSPSRAPPAGIPTTMIAG